MGFLLDAARSMEFRRRKRDAMTEIYKAQADLNFLRSSDGQAIYGKDAAPKQEKLVEQMIKEYRQMFGSEPEI